MLAPEFERFWNTWPKNGGRYSRKGGKAQCLKVWTKNYNFSQADTIIKHVEWLKTTPDWLKDQGAFIPAPLVYLNQQRWDGADVPDQEHGKGRACEPIEESADVIQTRCWMRERDSIKASGPTAEQSAKLAALRQSLKAKGL